MQTSPQKVDSEVDSDEPNPALAQLRKLRTGVGLTEECLGGMGALMSALGTSDPRQGYLDLLRSLGHLKDRDGALALTVDYGLDLTTLLLRGPHDWERQWLGERRSAYATVVGRDVKTLARWSDRAVRELRAGLLNDRFTGDLTVVVAVDGDRIAGATLIQDPAGRDGTSTVGTRWYHENLAEGPSLSCFVYGYPRD